MKTLKLDRKTDGTAFGLGNQVLFFPEEPIFVTLWISIARGWEDNKTLNGAPLLCFEVVEVQVVDTVTVLHPSKHVDPL